MPSHSFARLGNGTSYNPVHAILQCKNAPSATRVRLLFGVTIPHSPMVCAGEAVYTETDESDYSRLRLVFRINPRITSWFRLPLLQQASCRQCNPDYEIKFCELMSPHTMMSRFWLSNHCLNELVLTWWSLTHKGPCRTWRVIPKPSIVFRFITAALIRCAIFTL